MRKWVIAGAFLLAGGAWFAQSDTAFLPGGAFGLSQKTFGDLEGYDQVIVLNTEPRIILAKRDGQTMVCPMPTKGAEDWEPCWEVRD